METTKPSSFLKTEVYLKWGERTWILMRKHRAFIVQLKYFYSIY